MRLIEISKSRKVVLRLKSVSNIYVNKHYPKCSSDEQLLILHFTKDIVDKYIMLMEHKSRINEIISDLKMNIKKGKLDENYFDKQKIHSENIYKGYEDIMNKIFVKKDF
jgi:hypothetical protein